MNVGFALRVVRWVMSTNCFSSLIRFAKIVVDQTFDLVYNVFYYDLVKFLSIYSVIFALSAAIIYTYTKSAGAMYPPWLSSGVILDSSDLYNKQIFMFNANVNGLV